MPVRRNDVDELTGVLIHDGECPFCSAAATALRRLPAVGTVEWDHEAAQEFLLAQFDEPPFAVVYADARTERVYVGRAAAVEVCGRAGVPALVRDLVDATYERAAGAAGTVASGSRDPDPVHGTYPLADAARNPLVELLEAAESASYVLPD